MEGAGEAVDGPEGLGDGGNDSVVFDVGVRVGGSEIVGGSLVLFVLVGAADIVGTVSLES